MKDSLGYGNSMRSSYFIFIASKLERMFNEPIFQLSDM